MEEERIDVTESHTWARTRMSLKSIKLSWIFKLTFFYFLTLFISSVLPTSNAKIPKSSFSDSFGYLDLESNNDIAELDEYNFKDVILEYPTVFVYFNFENNNKRNAAVLQTLELVAQLLSNKNVLVAKVTDKQFARTLDVTESGSFCAYHKGNIFPFYGYPVADVIMHFILKIKEPVVKEITGKETKVAFDKVDVPTFVGFFEEENQEYSVFEEAALSYLPYVQFYATFDENVALHLKLNEPGTYRYRRPLEEKSFLIEERLGTTEDVHSVVDKYRSGPLQKFSLHNIYHPWNKEEKEDEFLAFADPKSPKGKTFHKILMKFIKKEMDKDDFDVKITWIDPSQYPMMIPIWENKYEINLSEPHFGHVTDSEVRWLDIQRVEEFEGKHEKHSVMRKWIRNEEDPYTPEEPEPEEVDGQGDEEAADDVNKEGGKTEEGAEQQTCSNEAECNSEETDGTEDKESEESENEGPAEVGEEEEEAETDEQQDEVDESAQGEEEFVIEDDWMDYFDRLEEMELNKDKEKEKKGEIKVEKVVEKPKPKDKLAEKPKVAKAKKRPDKDMKKEQRKKAKVVLKEPKEKPATTTVELEETLNEINQLVDKITNGNTGHDTKTKEQAEDIKEERIKPKVDETVKVPKSEEVSPEESVSEEIPTAEILQTAEEIIMENEALRKENGELRQELKEELEEEEDEEDDDDDEEEEDVTPQKPDVKKQTAFKDAENCPTYNVDLDVLVDSFEEGTKDEWDQYFDDLEQKKSSKPQPDQQVPNESKLRKKKHVPESQVYKEENYPHYDVDLDVLVDSFEGGAQDEWTRYFDALEAEEDKRLNEKVKKKKGRRSGGGSSFFAEGMPMKDNKTRIRQFLEREKQRREQMKHKIDRDSIKSYLKGKSNEKKKENPKETIENVNEKTDTEVEELLVEENTIEQDPQAQNNEMVDDSSILRQTLLKLVKDVEKLLYQNGHTNGNAKDEAATVDKVSTEETKTDEVKDTKSKKLKGDLNTEKSSKLKGDNLEIFPSNIDLTDPESIVNTIKHTTTVANKIMQEFADSLTAQLLDVKAARARNGGDDDDEGDEPWEVIEERDEKLKELCKKGRLSSADCNQVIHGRSMEHVHNFHKVKSPKVPRFKPSPPSASPEPEPEPEQLQEPTEENADKIELKYDYGTTDQETQKEPVEALDIQAEPTFDDNIMSETGTNFDESLFYDQETIDRKEEEKFYYKFEDWESPASSSPIVKGALDYRSQKYFDALEGIDTMTTTPTMPLPQDEHLKVEAENTVKDHKAESKQKKEHESNNSAREKVGKEEKKKKEKKQDKICDCEKERKQLKSKKDKHYDEEEWENGKFNGKKESSDSKPCDCKWKLLP